MRYYVLLLLALVALCPQTSHAQKQYNLWDISGIGGIDFNGPTPVFWRHTSPVDDLMHAVICDRTTGSLLFSTNGRYIWNRNDQPIDSINEYATGDRSQIIIVPAPDDPMAYYIFCASQGGTTDAGFFYVIVDMRLNGGLGGVRKPYQKVLANNAMKLAVVQHCDGHSYWAITHGEYDNRFYAYLLSGSGLSSPIISAVGGSGINVVTGPLKASPDGTMLASVFETGSAVDLLRFDKSTGIVSNPIRLQSVSNFLMYGATFSPNSSKLYAPMKLPDRYRTDTLIQGLYQFDVTQYDSAAIMDSRWLVKADRDAFLGMQIGPDRKVYMPNTRTDAPLALSAINFPDVKGNGCGFQDSAIAMPRGTTALPILIDSYIDSIAFLSMTGGPDIDICVGDTATLRGAGAASYRWSPTFEMNCYNCAQPRVWPPVTTTFKLVATNDSGCTVTDYVTVTVHPKIVADAGPGGTICRGDSLQLNATGGDSLTWRWSPADGLSCADCRSPKASPLSTTLYTVTASNGGYCTATDTVRVVVLDPPAADAGQPQTICRGDSVRLNGSASGKVVWSPGDDLSCSDCATPMAHPTKTTLYQMTVTGANGCVATDTTSVTVVDAPMADAGIGGTICRGDSLQLNAGDAATWAWSPTQGLSCIDCRNPKASPATTTLYTVTVSSGGSCAATDTVGVMVLDAPQADAGRDTTICPGESVALHASGGVSYRWSTAPGLSCLDCADPIASPAATTLYVVTASNPNGCSRTDSVLVTVVAAGGVDAGPPQTICSGDSVQLHASDGVAWLWSPSAGLSCTDCRSPMASPVATALYTVKVSAAGGCSATDTTSVTVLPAVRISGGEDRSICSGQRAQLHGSGGVSYRWSPADGLSCTDCSDPIASPVVTTSYKVTGTGANGCTGSATVTVVVSDGEEVHAAIDSNLRMVPGSGLTVPVVLEDAIAQRVDTVTIGVGYRGGILRLAGASTSETLLSGWRQETIADTIGGLSLRLIATGDHHITGTGKLLDLSLLAFIGDTTASPLPLNLSFGEQPCLRVMASGGRVTLDSICGLSFRLIESSRSSYTLKQNSPNPFNPTTTIEFTLGLDGATQLEIMDGSGKRVAMLVDGELSAGGYTVSWDASTMASGLYYYRLRSGNWSQTGRMLLLQ